MSQKADLQDVLIELESELTRLQTRLAGKSEGEKRRDGANADQDDLAHDFVARERRLALGDVDRAQMKQVVRAMERIADGTYGNCDVCGEEIALERLKIIPYATACVSCQHELDQG